jgi:hypothetical protein
VGVLLTSEGFLWKGDQYSALSSTIKPGNCLDRHIVSAGWYLLNLLLDQRLQGTLLKPGCEVDLTEGMWGSTARWAQVYTYAINCLAVDSRSIEGMMASSATRKTALKPRHR